MTLQSYKLPPPTAPHTHHSIFPFGTVGGGGLGAFGGPALGSGGLELGGDGLGAFGGAMDEEATPVDCVIEK